MNWRYFRPKFEYQEKSLDQDLYWGGHRYFAYDLISNLKPSLVVELGTHKGTSFFSFCQAAKDNHFETKLFAVDTWKGDAHAGFYDGSVYDSVEEIRKRYFGGIDVNFLKMTFDEALQKFDEASIDVLHIDGFHTYEAVKHDFETWFPKVKSDGMVLFHDTANKDYEVTKFWIEMRKKFKTMEFTHSGGLGILVKGIGRHSKIFDCEDIWQKYYALLWENEELNRNIDKESKRLEKSNQELNFLKSSKFWKLWEKYLRLKGKFQCQKLA